MGLQGEPIAVGNVDSGRGASPYAPDGSKNHAEIRGSDRPTQVDWGGAEYLRIFGGVLFKPLKPCL
jgi:hypothetical protein